MKVATFPGTPIIVVESSWKRKPTPRTGKRFKLPVDSQESFVCNWTSSVPRDVVMDTIRCISDKVIPAFK